MIACPLWNVYSSPVPTPPSLTMSSTQNIKWWLCDKCRLYAFDTIEEAIEHERTCPVVSSGINYGGGESTASPITLTPSSPSSLSPPSSTESLPTKPPAASIDAVPASNPLPPSKVAADAAALVTKIANVSPTTDFIRKKPAAFFEPRRSDVAEPMSIVMEVSCSQDAISDHRSKSPVDKHVASNAEETGDCNDGMIHKKELNHAPVTQSVVDTNISSSKEVIDLISPEIKNSNVPVSHLNARRSGRIRMNQMRLFSTSCVEDTQGSKNKPQIRKKRKAQKAANAHGGKKTKGKQLSKQKKDPQHPCGKKDAKSTAFSKRTKTSDGAGPTASTSDVDAVKSCLGSPELVKSRLAERTMQFANDRRAAREKEREKAARNKAEECTDDMQSKSALASIFSKPKKCDRPQLTEKNKLEKVVSTKLPVFQPGGKSVTPNGGFQPLRLDHFMGKSDFTHLFPVPNHVAVESKESHYDIRGFVCGVAERIAARPTFQRGKASMATDLFSSLHNIKLTLISPENNLVKCERLVPRLADRMHLAFSNATSSNPTNLVESAASRLGLAEETRKEDFHRFESVHRKYQNKVSLLSELYMPRAIPQDICSSHNKYTALALQKFLKEWEEIRQNYCSSKNLFKSCLKGQDLYRDSGYDSEEDNGPMSTALLVGPTSSGKTCLVEGLARQHSFRLLEINTAHCRSGPSLKERMEEATQSVSLMKRSEDADECEEEAKHAMTVILLDEVDIVFDNGDDAGFWASVKHLSKRSKCPIIMTASNVPKELETHNIRHQIYHMDRPSVDECVYTLANVAVAENLSVSLETLQHICTLLKCDLRRALHELQARNFRASSTKMIEDENNAIIGSRSLTVRSKCPIITGLDPKTFCSKTGGKMKIYGKNFRQEKVNVTVKDIPCVSVLVVSDSIIECQVPPATYPAGVDEYGIDTQTYDESMTSKYCLVVVSARNAGRVLRSDSACFSSNKGVKESPPLPLKEVWNIQYSFPQMLGKLELLMKKKTKRKELEKKSTITDTDFLDSDCSDHDEKMVDQNSDVAINESSSTLNEESIENPNLIETSSVSNSQDEIMASILPQNSFEEHETNLQELDQLSKFCHLSSECAFLEDVMDLSPPFLEGAVLGFGGCNLQKVGILNGNNSSVKPPSNEKLYQSGLNDRGYFGCSECHMTCPNHAGDRRLIRGGTSIDQPHVRSMDEDVGEEFENWEMSSVDVFMEIPHSAVSSLPSVVHSKAKQVYKVKDIFCPMNTFLKQRTVNNDVEITTSLQNFVDHFIPSNIKKIQFSEEVLNHPFYSSTDAMAGNELNRTLSLDYLPMLRNIAVVLAQKEHLDADGKETLQTGLQGGVRRSTRTTRKRGDMGKTHYFDYIMQNDSGIGKKIACDIAKTVLQFNKTSP